MDAEQVLRNASQRSPGLVALALLLSPAVRIEPELIRAVRLDLLPGLPAGTEGDLWFSALISARGLDGIVLHAGVANLLRVRARAILLPSAGVQALADGPGHDDIRRARDLIDQLHASSPPVLRLEETVNWLAVSEENPEAGIEAELQLAVEAFRRGRTGVARWAARALARMPEAARGTTAAWLLAQGARSRLGSRDWGGTGTPDIGRIDDLALMLPRREDVPLGVRRSGTRLDLGEVGRDGMSVRVLDTDPRVLAVRIQGQEAERVVQVPRGSQVSLLVEGGPVRLRTPRGEIYQADETPVDVVSVLPRSCVTVEATGTTAIGVAVAADQVLTVLPGSAMGGAVTVTGPSGARVVGEVTAVEGGFVLLRVTGLPDGVQPAALSMTSEPEPGERWYGVVPDPSVVWTIVNGIVSAATATSFTVTLSDPVPRMMPGCPVIVGGVFAGLVTSLVDDRRYTWYVASLASAMSLLELRPEPSQLADLGRIANAITLEFHMRFSGFVPEVEDQALPAAAGLTVEQFDALRGLAEWTVQAGVSVRTAPRWRLPSGPSQFSSAVLAALDEAAEVLRSSRYLEPRLGAEGVTGSGEEGFAVDRLRAALASELPGFDDWDPWSARPAREAWRTQDRLGSISRACSGDARVPEPARTVLIDASRRLYPDWWDHRDHLVRLGLPDVSADQAFPDYLEAYLGWCLTVLHRLGTSAGERRYTMGYSISRRGAEALPVARFGLDALPAQRQDDYVNLAGRFQAMLGLWAWAFLELTDQVRLAALHPPRYEVPPSPASA